jgi:hypothetical protein
MALLDHLIDKGKTPSDAEYLYSHDTVWEEGVLRGIPVDKDFLVTDVIQKDTGGYLFTIPGRLGRFRCNYAWAFVVSTPENLERLAAYRRFQKRVQRLEAELGVAYDGVEKLSGT